MAAELTVIVPTRDRHELLREAVESALAQTREVRVVVVDDGSATAVELPADPRLALLRQPQPRGVSAARNLGLAAAATPWVAFLDDDDRLRAHFAERSLEELARADAPPPVGVLSAVAAFDREGRVREVRLPPPLRPRGDHFSLEPLEPGRSYACKQTLVAPREALLGVGGFDERLRSRVVTELFWRLNPACSLVGFDDVTYDLRAHPGARLSAAPDLRRESFARLLALHGDLLRAHPDGYAALLAEHARRSWRHGQRATALAAALRHASVAPGRTARALASPLRGLLP